MIKGFKRRLKKKRIQLYKVKVVAMDEYGKTYCSSPTSNTIERKLYMDSIINHMVPGRIINIQLQGDLLD